MLTHFSQQNFNSLTLVDNLNLRNLNGFGKTQGALALLFGYRAKRPPPPKGAKPFKFEPKSKGFWNRFCFLILLYAFFTENITTN